MAARVRRNVWKLPADDQTLEWYRKAITELIPRPASDPTSWRYLAAVHGRPSNLPVPPGTQNFWDQCQHQSWFFLSWHRGYLAAFEAVIARTVESLGGPADWALPFWDYSDTANPNARLMPPAFRDRTLPDGSANALWGTRAQSTNGNFGITPQDTSLNALTIQNFTNNRPGRPSGFGGPVTGFNPGGGDNGAVESIPHNILHVRIGGNGGFMSFPSTAALDPIFWLHHANIDRLWEVWRNQGSQFQNPTDARWLTGVKFRMHDGGGQPFTFQSVDVLDTTRFMHGYMYEGVPVPQVLETLETVEMVMEGSGEGPELVGATENPVPLTGPQTKADVVLLPGATKSSPGSLEGMAAERAYLSLENVTGTGMPGNFRVYIDLLDDANEPAFVGMLTTFGLERASDPTSVHGGSGLGQVFDITDLVGRIGLTSENVSRLKVTFVREDPAPVESSAPEGLEGLAETPPDPKITVGKISLYYD